jgi:polyvinyl alcohol dehydrogenase (cytochrome)
MGGQNLQNSRSQSATTITPANVGALQQAWVFTAAGDISATPAVSNGTVYFPDYGGYFHAVNAMTGASQWSQPVAAWTGVSGDWARTYPAIDGETLVLGDGAGSYAQWTAAAGLTTALAQR